MKLEELPSTIDVPNLAQEIREGRLSLRGDDRARFRFSFSVEAYPIGVFAVKSTGPFAVSLLRCWNKSSSVFDPISGLALPVSGRQFVHVAPGKPMFLVEYTHGFEAVVSKVAFKARHVKVYNADVPGMPEDMRFEAVELREVEILG